MRHGGVSVEGGPLKEWNLVCEIREISPKEVTLCQKCGKEREKDMQAREEFPDK